jgi:cell division septation protein DedD
MLVSGLVGSPARADFAAGSAAYERGDFALALEEWRPLAEAGDLRAQYNLGYMHFNGVGLPRNYPEAAKWYRAAADQEDPSAQLNLGNLYAEGKGMARDYAEAYFWFSLAINSLPEGPDLEQANRNREIVAGQLSQRQIRKALRQALVWAPVKPQPSAASAMAPADSPDETESSMAERLVANLLRMTLPELELGNDSEGNGAVGHAPPIPAAKPLGLPAAVPGQALAAIAGRPLSPADPAHQPERTPIALPLQPDPGAAEPAPKDEGRPHPKEGSFVVQLAAMKSRSDAKKEWLRLKRAFPDLLGSRNLLLDTGDRGGFYRVRTGPLANRKARELCRVLTARSQACFVVAPNGATRAGT